MPIQVLLFGPARSTAGSAEIVVSCTKGISPTVGYILESLIEQHPSIATIARTGRLAVNSSFVPNDTIINEHDEVALIAMVSGG